MGRMVLHQFSESAIEGDAITDQALLIRRWLRNSGYQSEIFTEHCRPEMENEVRPVSSYRRQRGEDVLIYHHAIGADVADRLLQLEIPSSLIYHNITPSGFFSQTDPVLSRQLSVGRTQLLALRKQTLLALGDSDFNELELKEAGYTDTGVLPIVLDPKKYAATPDPGVMARFGDGRRNLLFLGRLAPNKKQEDLMKLLHYYRRIEPGARLILVGSALLANYTNWLHDFAHTLNLEDSVVFTGHVSQAEMIAYYQIADLYVSMSEHEGFGKPLIESMYFDLPVLDYSSTAIPYTLGNAGVLFRYKHYEALAEVTDILITDEGVRQRIVEGQRRRVQDYLEPRVHERWLHFLKDLEIL
ncbi:MAG: glycosyltransferase [Candidatus Promineifilaceae bacterium]